MNILIIGSGGREHALAWKAAQSPDAERVYVAPGNAGTAREPGITNAAIAADDIDGLIRFARDENIRLTIVGPEAPLVAGIVDRFRDAGLRCFGPGREAAQLEGSKVFTKDFLQRHNIPAARSWTFADAGEACALIRRQGAPLVIKADGLAAGKGVVVAHTVEEAEQAARSMLVEGQFGEASRRILVEEFLAGEEASYIVLCDGEHVLPMATSQDHKARDEGDHGPNTGGMGAYSPAPVITPEIERHILRDIIEPTVRGMAADGHPYTGFLYAGLMIDSDGQARVLEFNCRFGDPETQPIMMRLRSDLVSLCSAAIDGRLGDMETQWDDRVALGVVLAANGYPANYRKGDVISGLPEAAQPNRKVFHAGSAERDGEVVTAGGRVLCACALGETVAEAQTSAYTLARQIHWEGVFYRGDIGYRAIARESRMR